MDSIWTPEEIRRCVKKTVDERLQQMLLDRPAAQISRPQRQEPNRLVESLSGLFLHIRLPSTQT